MSSVPPEDNIDMELGMGSDEPPRLDGIDSRKDIEIKSGMSSKVPLTLSILRSPTQKAASYIMACISVVKLQQIANSINVNAHYPENWKTAFKNAVQWLARINFLTITGNNGKKMDPRLVALLPTDTKECQRRTKFVHITPALNSDKDLANFEEYFALKYMESIGDEYTLEHITGPIWEYHASFQQFKKGSDGKPLKQDELKEQLSQYKTKVLGSKKLKLSLSGAAPKPTLVDMTQELAEDPVATNFLHGNWKIKRNHLLTQHMDAVNDAGNMEYPAHMRAEFARNAEMFKVQYEQHLLMEPYSSGGVASLPRTSRRDLFGHGGVPSGGGRQTLSGASNPPAQPPSAPEVGFDEFISTFVDQA